MAHAVPLCATCCDCFSGDWSGDVSVSPMHRAAKSRSGQRGEPKARSPCTRSSSSMLPRVLVPSLTGAQVAATALTPPMRFVLSQAADVQAGRQVKRRAAGCAWPHTRVVATAGVVCTSHTHDNACARALLRTPRAATVDSPAEAGVLQRPTAGRPERAPELPVPSCERLVAFVQRKGHAR